MPEENLEMPQPPVVVSLPIADRPRSFAFYHDGLEFGAIGEPAEDPVLDSQSVLVRE